MEKWDNGDNGDKIVQWNYLIREVTLLSNIKTVGNNIYSIHYYFVFSLGMLKNHNLFR